MRLANALVGAVVVAVAAAIVDAVRCSLFVYTAIDSNYGVFSLVSRIAAVARLRFWHRWCKSLSCLTFSHLRMFEREAYYPLVRT